MVAMLSECASASAAVTMPGELASFEVAGSVGLAVGAEVLRVVVDARNGGENAAFAEGHAIKRGVEGRGVDERLEDGARGALGHGVVQLRKTVVSATYER